LRILATKATTQETAVTGVSTTNRTGRLQVGKPDHPVSLRATTSSGQQHKHWVPEGVSSINGSGGNQDQIGPRSGTSTDDEAKHDTEKGPEEVAAKQNKAQGEETEIRANAMASF
jgi:hypothetical protein